MDRHSKLVIPAETVSPEQSFSLRFAIGPVYFSLTARTLVVCRGDKPDLPHVTLSWSNPSGELDFHLTTRREGGVATHVPITQIEEARARDFLKDFDSGFKSAVRANLDQARSVRPGWLARRRYLVILVDDAETPTYLPFLVNRRRRRHHLNFGLMLDAAFQRRMLENAIFSPQVLPSLGADFTGVIRAFRQLRGRKVHWVSLHRFRDSRGISRWIAVDERRVRIAIAVSVEPTVRSFLRYLGERTRLIVDAIWDALLLEDFADFRGTRSRICDDLLGEGVSDSLALSRVISRIAS